MASEINPFELYEPSVKKKAAAETSKNEDFDKVISQPTSKEDFLPDKSYLRFINLEEGNYSWRRFFARMIDFKIMSIVIISCFLVAEPSKVSRLLEFPHENPLFTLTIGIISGILLLIVEIFTIAFFSYTPGKWLCCIKITDLNGNKLSIYKSAKRSLLVYTTGCAFYLPILSLFTICKAAFDLRQKRVTYWDDACETQVTVSKLNWVRIILIIVALMLA